MSVDGYSVDGLLGSLPSTTAYSGSAAYSVDGLIGPLASSTPFVGYDGYVVDGLIGELPSTTAYAGTAAYVVDGLIGELADTTPYPTGVGAGTTVNITGNSIGFQPATGLGSGFTSVATGTSLGLQPAVGQGSGVTSVTVGTSTGFQPAVGIGAGSTFKATGSGISANPVLGFGTGATPVLSGTGFGLVPVVGTGSGIISAVTGTGSDTLSNKFIIAFNIPIRRFSGESDDPLLSGTLGNIYFSPSFESPNVNNDIHIDFVESSTNAGDTYLGNKKPVSQQRPFLWGPPPSVPSTRLYPPNVTIPDYLPVFNSSYSFVGSKVYNVSGVLYDTVSLTSTYIFY